MESVNAGNKSLNLCKNDELHELNIESLFECFSDKVKVYKGDVRWLNKITLNNGEAVMICIKNRDEGDVNNENVNEENNYEVLSESDGELSQELKGIACLVAKKRAKTKSVSGVVVHKGRGGTESENL